MFPVIQAIVTAGRANRPALGMSPLYITIHNTDNDDPGADAKAHANYVKTLDGTTSWHFTVDDRSIYQHIPTWENAWHAGDGHNGNGNRTSIGIEICMNPECDEAQANRNAAELVAYLIATIPSLKPFPECMKQHYDWTGKNCPSVIRSRPNGWENFLALIQAKVGGTAVDQWKKDAIKKLEDLGILMPGAHAPGEPVDMGLLAAVIINLLLYLRK